MTKAFLLFAVCLLWFGFAAYSQLPCYAECEVLSLETPKYSNITVSPPFSYGKSNATNYKDAEYHNSVSYLDDCGVNVDPMSEEDCLTNAQSYLKYIVYYPSHTEYSKAEYDECPLPAIVLFHAGGFSDCNPITEAFTIDQMCSTYARLGYVAFNVEYRTGRLLDAVPGPQSYYSGQQVLAFYRGFQDGRGALRSIIKRQNEADANSNFQIDINYIFVGGASAGAAIAINLGYYPTQTMVNAICPGAQARLGDVDIDFYYGGTNIAYFGKIKGVLNMWGNGFLPVTSAPLDFFQRLPPFLQ